LSVVISEVPARKQSYIVTLKENIVGSKGESLWRAQSNRDFS